MFASLRERGKMAVVLDTGAVSRGSGNTGSNRERDIRKQFVERDLVEAVLLLPENLFYNTTAPGIIMVVNKAKRHRGEILLVNASKEFSKGKPKNFLTEENIERIADAHLKWAETEKLTKVIAVEEAVRNDYNISPSRYVAVDGLEEVLPIEEAVVLLREAEEERASVDGELGRVFEALGLGGQK
jgi:type I restriction enzyme M protein